MPIYMEYEGVKGESSDPKNDDRKKETLKENENPLTQEEIEKRNEDESEASLEGTFALVDALAKENDSFMA